MISTEQSLYLISTASHGGKGGQVNEDRFRVENFFLDEAHKRTACFAVLADGLGAQRAGQVAAELAVDAIAAFVGHSDASQPSGILQAALVHANRVLAQRAESRPEWEGMGSTCLCAWVVGDRLYAASLGSSRLYLLRGRHLQLLNVLRPLTGEISVEAKPKRGRKNNEGDPLRGYLGSKAQLEIDLKLDWDARKPTIHNQGLRLLPNDRLLLCSDGLGEALKDSEVVEILGERSAEEAASALVDFGLEKGTAHNMTAVVIAMPPGRPPLAPVAFNWRRALVTMVMFAALVVLGLLSWYVWLKSLQIGSPPEPTPIHTLTPIPTNTPIQ
jgi:serine/threonine protein phosphatase PrpC